jgi:hypothetical protein
MQAIHHSSATNSKPFAAKVLNASARCGIVSALLLCGLTSFAQDSPRPIINPAQAFAISQPVRTMATARMQSFGNLSLTPIPSSHSVSGEAVVDTVEQNASTPSTSFTLGLNVFGIGNGFPNYMVTDWHPLPSLAVGDTQLVQWVKDGFAVFDKATGTPLTGVITSSQLFQSLNPCSRGGLGVGVAMWDKAAHRWLLTMNRSALTSYTCVAISTSADATGSYYLFGYSQGNLNVGISQWGGWADGYYKSQDEFQYNGDYLGARICAYQRAKLLAGDPSALEICFHLSPADSLPQPADVDSIVPPPTGQDEMFAGVWDASHLSVYSLHADFSNPQNSFATGNNGSQLIEVPAFTPPCNGVGSGDCVPQQDVPDQLEDWGQLLNSRLVYWDDNPPLHATATPPLPAPSQHWYMVHPTTANGGTEAPRWYEFTAPQRNTPVTGIHLFQSGTFAPDANHRWTSSLARDKNHNILMGYNVPVRPCIPPLPLPAEHSRTRRALSKTK